MHTSACISEKPDIAHVAVSTLDLSLGVDNVQDVHKVRQIVLNLRDDVR
jgi:hypothetical protein